MQWCRGLFEAVTEGCQNMSDWFDMSSEALNRAGAGEPVKVKALAACALMQNPMLDDPEHEW